MPAVDGVQGEFPFLLGKRLIFPAVAIDEIFGHFTDGIAHEGLGLLQIGSGQLKRQHLSFVEIFDIQENIFELGPVFDDGPTGRKEKAGVGAARP